MTKQPQSPSAAKAARKRNLLWTVIYLTFFMVVGLLTYTLLKDAVPVVQEGEPEGTDKYITGLEVNDYLEHLIEQGYIDKVYAFYDEVTGRREVTYNVVMAAIIHRIPVHFLLAMAWQESRFTPRAIGKNGNGSRDIGLFQINERIHKQHKMKDLLDVRYCTAVACNFLTGHYTKYGSWTEAAIFFHRGGGTIDRKGVDYAISVQQKCEEFDKIFNNGWKK